ncbi:unnamed protein product [Penicillium pancosmium]
METNEPAAQECDTAVMEAGPLEVAHHRLGHAGPPKLRATVEALNIDVKNEDTFNGELSTAQRQNIIKFSCRQRPDNFETIRTLGRGIVGMAGSGVHFRDRQIKSSDEMTV